MNTDFTVKPSGELPVGSYFAVFKNVVPFDGNDKIDGERWKWLWEVTTGPLKGREVSALTDPTFTAGNKAGKFVAGMAGRALQTGEDLSPVIESCKGKRFVLSVAGGPKGGKVGVQAVSLPPEE